MLLLLCYAFAQDDEDLDDFDEYGLDDLEPDPEPEPEPSKKRDTVALSFGLGASVLAGGNGDAYSPGFAESLAVELYFSKYSTFYFGFNHTWHKLTDSRPYFPDHDVTPGILQGGQTLISPELGFRLGLKLRGMKETGVRGWPSVRIGLGNAFTSTRLVLPAFEGPIAYTSQGYAPFFSAGVGAELRFRENLSLVPEVRGWWMGYMDGSEVEEGGVWGIETRIQPTIALNATW
jgi:hypothetical protein